MKHKILFNTYLFALLFWIGLLQAEGFTADTCVLTPRGTIPIKHLIVGDYVIANDSAYPITHITRSQTDTHIKINIGSTSICAAENQKFYLFHKNQWVNANALAPLDQLLYMNNNTISIDDINVIHVPQVMYALSINTSHQYHISPYGIIVHNIEPVTTGLVATMIVACSALFPPAAVAITIGKIATLGAVGIGAYCAYKKTQANKKQLQFFHEPPYSANKKNNDGCFSLNDTTPPTTPCYPLLDKPVDHHINHTVAVEKPTSTDVLVPHITPESTKTDCVFPREINDASILCFEDTQKNAENKTKRYNGPKYNRTEDWINEHPFGQEVKNSLKRSPYTNQGKRAFELIKKLQNCDGFRKGEYVVIDALHNDHLEVFSKHGSWSHVANFDGTINYEKTKQGQKDKRQPLQKG